MRRTALASVGFLVLVIYAVAAADKVAVDGIKKVAGLLRTKGNAAADKEAVEIAKNITDIDEFMAIFKPRRKGGLGVGAPNQFLVDGIEFKVLALDRAALAPATLAREAK